jgi:hypothetical protein
MDAREMPYDANKAGYNTSAQNNPRLLTDKHVNHPWGKPAMTRPHLYCHPRVNRPQIHF